MQVDMLMFADAATDREGLLNVIGGGLDSFTAMPPDPSGPTTLTRPDGTEAKIVGRPMHFNLVIRVSERPTEPVTNRQVVVRIVEQDGALMSEMPLHVRMETNPNRPKGWDRRANILLHIEALPTAFGEHRLDVDTDGKTLASIQFRILKPKMQVSFRPN